MTGGSAFSLTLRTVGASSSKAGASFTSVTLTMTFTVAEAVDGSLTRTRRTYSLLPATPASSSTGSAGPPARDVESSSSGSPASAPSALPTLIWPEALSMVNRASPTPSSRSGVSSSS